MTLPHHLVIFVRAPRLGTGKRRLARDLGAVAAWRFQRQMLARLRRRLAGDPRWTTWLAVTPDRAAFERGLWPAGLRVMPQGSGDLGTRMSAHLAERSSADTAPPSGQGIQPTTISPPSIETTRGTATALSSLFMHAISSIRMNDRTP